jgi:hypothetical protein
MNQTTLAALDYAALADAFNRVYEGYIVPFNVGVDWVEQHIRANDIDRSLSPLWLDDDGEVVGMALLGVRGARGWVGGKALLAALIERSDGGELTVVNEPEGSELLPALFDAGWTEIMRQHEMMARV